MWRGGNVSRIKPRARSRVCTPFGQATRWEQHRQFALVRFQQRSSDIVGLGAY